MSDLFPETIPIIDPMEDAKRILREAIEQYQPRHIAVGFSGGNDSVTIVEICQELDIPFSVMHIHTTIRIPAVGEYVHDFCSDRRLTLEEYTPPVSYAEIVKQFGFPGWGQHPTTYARLKERCIREFRRRHKEAASDRIMMVTGVRKAESRRRMGTVKEIQRDGSVVWVAPATNWTTEVRDAYLKKKRTQENPVARKMCMSGECMCGCGARPEEFAELEAVWPRTARRIGDLSVKLRKSGLHAEWGKDPPIPPDPRQIAMGFCWSCEARNEKDKP